MDVNRTILLTLTLLAALRCQAVGKLLMTPRDTEVKANHSTYFNCSTDSASTAIFWFHGTNYVYTGFAILEPYDKRFSVDLIARNGTYIYNLVIHSVQPSDAGEYICADDEGYGEKYSVQLIVLEDNLKCRSNKELDEVIGQNSCNIEPDDVELECSVTYHGHIPPQLEWKKVGENISTPLEVSVVNPGNRFVSTLKVKGDIALNNSSYVCETRRSTQEPIQCTSEVIKTLYALSGNSTVNGSMGDEIHCNANTSQSCSYKWRWLQDNDYTIESSTSVLKARKPGWHRCEAECYLRNISCDLLVKRTMIYGEKEESNQIRNIIISVVVTVVVTLILACVLIVVLAICHGKKEQVDNNIASDESATVNEDDVKKIRLLQGQEQFDSDHVVLNELLKEPVRAIYGMAVLGDEMFISRLQRSDIEVYDSTTFVYKRRIKVDGMTNPEHIVSCSVNNCLYAFDWGYMKRFTAMLRIAPNNGNLITKWNISGRGGRLSVASDTNVILNINYETKLHEYTADGHLIRVINLDSPGKPTGIFRAWHAVKLDNVLFVVCHGDYDDPLCRVCLLSTKSVADASRPTNVRIDEVEILKVFGAEPGESISKLLSPTYLSVDRHGSILVSDSSNKGAILLNSNLEQQQIIASMEHEIRLPWRTCFNELLCQWFVADYHRVMVCQIKDGKVERKLHNLISH